MPPISCGLKHSDLTDKIIGVFYDVYNELGHGFLESTYAQAMFVALESLGLAVSSEVPVPVWFRGRKIGQYFADLLVEETVILELKAALRWKAHTRPSCFTICGQRKSKSACCSILAFVLNSGACCLTTKEKRSAKIRVNPWPKIACKENAKDECPKTDDQNWLRL